MSRLTKVSIDSVLYEIGSKGINSYATLSEMVNEKVSELYDGCIAWCNEDLKYYQWLSTNEIISIFGRWRELEFGSEFQVDDPTVDAGAEKYKEKIIQYIGADDTTHGFKRGYFYESKKSNTVNYIVAVVDETTAGTFYLLEDDGTYTEVVLVGDGTNYDVTKTYYKKQEVDVYTWRYVNIFDGYATEVKYKNDAFPDLTNVNIAIDNILAKIYYVNPSCSLSASPTGGTFEMGTTITAPIEFTWTVNKEIVSQTLTNCTIELADRTATYDMDITSDKTFTLSVSDGENSATSSVSYKFMNNVFWGSAPTVDTYDSAFISALSNKKLTNSVKGTYSFNVETGEYGFWAVPSNMTISTVWIGGFEVTVEDLGTVSYTNAQGYTRDYNLYKTSKSGLGSISAEIK